MPPKQVKGSDAEPKKPQDDKPKDAKKQDKPICGPGEAANGMQFPSPLYVSGWCDEKHVFVGGGGGGLRFGMSNFVSVVKVDSEKIRKADPEDRCWKPVSSVSMGENIVWCVSKMVDASSVLGSGVTGKVFAVSHVNSFSLLRYDAGKLSDLANVPVNVEEDNPDKKPVALANGCAFIAQDNCAVAIFSIKRILESAKDDDKAKSSSAALLYEIKDVFEDRISDLDAVPITKDLTLLVATCTDKRFRALVVSHDEDLGGAAVVGKLVADGPALNLPFAPFKSSLRLTKLMPVKKVKEKDADSSYYTAEVIIASFHAHESHTFMHNSLLKIAKGDKKGSYSVSISHPEGSPAKLFKDAVTYLSHGGTGATNWMASGAEGSVAELKVESGKAPELIRFRSGLHKEPASSVAALCGPNAAVVTTDIAQRVMVWSLNTDEEAKTTKVKDQTAFLFALQKKKGGGPPLALILMVIFFLVTVASAVVMMR